MTTGRSNLFPTSQRTEARKNAENGVPAINLSTTEIWGEKGGSNLFKIFLTAWYYPLPFQMNNISTL